MLVVQRPCCTEVSRPLYVPDRQVSTILLRQTLGDLRSIHRRGRETHAEPERTAGTATARTLPWLLGTTQKRLHILDGLEHCSSWFSKLKTANLFLRESLVMTSSLFVSVRGE